MVGMIQGIALTTLVLELISLCNIHCLDPFWTQRWFSYIFVYSFHDGYTWMTHPMSICEQHIGYAWMSAISGVVPFCQRLEGERPGQKDNVTKHFSSKLFASQSSCILKKHRPSTRILDSTPIYFALNPLKFKKIIQRSRDPGLILWPGLATGRHRSKKKPAEGIVVGVWPKKRGVFWVPNFDLRQGNWENRVKSWEQLGIAGNSCQIMMFLQETPDFGWEQLGMSGDLCTIIMF